MQTTELEPRVQEVGTEDDEIVGLFKNTPEEESSTEEEARELDSAVVLSAWKALNAEQQHFLLRSILSDHEQFNALTAKQLKDYQVRGERAKANRMVLMRGMRKLLVGFPDEKDIALMLLHAARGEVRRLGITEADRKRLGEAAGTGSAESIMEEIRTRVQGEQNQLAAFLEKRIDEIIGRGDDDTPPAGAEAPGPEPSAEPEPGGTTEAESPAPEIISPELWRELEELGFDYIETPLPDGTTEFTLFLDPTSDRLDPELQRIFNFAEAGQAKTPEQEMKARAETSWQQAETTIANQLRALIKERIKTAEYKIKHQLATISHAALRYPTEEQAEGILKKLKEHYPEKALAVYIKERPTDPNQLMHISKTGDTVGAREVTAKTRRPLYAGGETMLFPILAISLGKKQAGRMGLAA